MPDSRARHNTKWNMICLAVSKLDTLSCRGTILQVTLDFTLYAKKGVEKEMSRRGKSTMVWS